MANDLGLVGVIELREALKQAGLRLTTRWLSEEAAADRIPSVLMGKRRLYSVEGVKAALVNRAKGSFSVHSSVAGEYSAGDRVRIRYMVSASGEPERHECAGVVTQVISDDPYPPMYTVVTDNDEIFFDARVICWRE